ncbi:MAG: DMT family transporter [Candidatus Falkowbacteria bacterium]
MKQNEETTDERKSAVKAYALAVLGVVCAALGPVLFQRLSTDFPAIWVIFWFLLSGGGFSLIAGAIILRLKGQRGLGTLNGKIIAMLALVGLTWTLYFYLYVFAISIKGATEASVLTRVGPLFNVIFAAAILKEKVKSWARVFLAAIICVVGLSVSTGEFVQSLTAGVSLCLVVGVMAGMFGALNYALLTREERRNQVDPLIAVGISMCFGAAILLMWLFVGEHNSNIVFPVNREQWLSIGVLGIVTVAMWRYCFVLAATASKMSKIGMVEYLIPIFVAIYAWLISNQTADYASMGGGLAIIIIGLLIADASVEKKKESS